VHLIVSELINEAALLMHKKDAVVLVLRAGLIPPDAADLLADLLHQVRADVPIGEDDGRQGPGGRRLAPSH
jgi:hypothetical protein